MSVGEWDRHSGKAKGSSNGYQPKPAWVGKKPAPVQPPPKKKKT